MNSAQEMRGNPAGVLSRLTMAGSVSARKKKK